MGENQMEVGENYDKIDRQSDVPANLIPPDEKKVRGFIADHKLAIGAIGAVTAVVLTRYYRNSHGHNED